MIILYYRNQNEHKISSDDLRNEVFHSDDNLRDLDKYGKTPPRTRILRKTRDRNKRDKEGTR